MTTPSRRQRRDRSPSAPTASRATAALLGLALLGTVGAALLLARGVAVAGGSPWAGGPSRLPQLVELAVCAGGAVAAGWLAASAAVAAACAATRSAGRRWATGERLVRAAAPVVVRRALAAAAGASLGLAGVVAAGAAPPPLDAGTKVAVEVVPPATDANPHGTSAPAGSAVPTPSSRPGEVDTAASGAGRAGTDVVDLGWRASTADPIPPAAPMPSTSASEPRHQAPGGTPDAAAPDRDRDVLARPASTSGAAGAPAAATVVVRPGDTLWALAGRQLGPGAGPAEIAAAWPRWYDANRSTIGEDPDLLRPGQVLVVPQDAR